MTHITELPGGDDHTQYDSELVSIRDVYVSGPEPTQDELREVIADMLGLPVGCIGEVEEYLALPEGEDEDGRVEYWIEQCYAEVRA